MPKKFDKKIFLLVMLALCLAAFLIWFAFFQQFGKIQVLSDDIQKEQLDSQVKQERNQKVLALGKELGDVETSQKEMSTILIDKDNAVPLLQSLEDIATETNNNITISVFDLTKLKSPATKAPAASADDSQTTKDVQKESQSNTASPKTSKPDYSNQLGFTVELTGKFQALVDFCTKLENLPYFVRVYNFQVIPSEKKQTGQILANSPAQTPDQAGQPAQTEGEDKNITSTLNIGVYTNTNGSK